MAMILALREYLAHARASSQGLDYLLASADQGRTLAERLAWVLELLEWLRSTPRVADTSSLDFRTGHGEAARFRYLMQTLGRNPEYQKSVAKTCRAILRDVDALEVFRSAGRRQLLARADGRDQGASHL
jgi:site-specific recombinase